MLILHSRFNSPTSIFLWAEDASTYENHKKIKNSISSENVHPFNSQISNNSLFKDLNVNKAEFEIMLPTFGKRPLPSAKLSTLLDLNLSTTNAKLTNWTVTGIVISLSDTISLLQSNAFDNFFVADSSVQFLNSLILLSLDLISRGRLLPSIDEESRYATFFPLPTSSDLYELSEITRNIPLVFLNDLTTPPGEIVGKLVNSILSCLISPYLKTLASQFNIDKRKLNKIEKSAYNFTKSLYSGNNSKNNFDIIAEPIIEWANSIGTSNSSFKTILQLREPADSMSWQLEIGLQPLDDPTLIVPAGDIWSNAPVTELLSKGGCDPEEWLLSELGKASRLFSQFEKVLEESDPEFLELSNEDLTDFLESGLETLEQSGFTVLVPSWFSKSSLSLKLKIKSSSFSMENNSTSYFNKGSLCQFDYKVALGGELISLSELQALSKFKSSVIEFKGKWMQVRQQDIQHALHLINKQASGKVTLIEALSMAASDIETQSQLEISEVETEGLISELINSTSSEVLNIANTPTTLVGQLRPYQQRGLSWLYFLDKCQLGGCLADDMGLGKTVQLISLLLLERDVNTKVGPTLLLAPMSLMTNWHKEAERFAPSLKLYVHHGISRETLKTFKKTALNSDLVLSTYSLALRDQQFLSEIKWHRVVLDEAQAIKNPSAKQTKAVKQIQARSKIALTGTPVENRLMELWSIMDFLNPGYLGNQEKFRQKFSIPIEKRGDKGAITALKKLSQPFILRRLKTDRSIISDLPDKVETKEYCNLTKEQTLLYQAVVDQMLGDINKATGIKRRGLVLTTLLRLKQICDHPQLLSPTKGDLNDRSGKILHLRELLDEIIEVKESALIFTQFAEMGYILQEYLSDTYPLEPLYIHGKVSKTARDQIVNRFQSGLAPILILSLKAGGVGLNLTQANHVIHFDRWWNPAVEEQATDRAFRIGQTKNVQVRKFICVGTLEEKIDAVIESKRTLSTSVIGAGEGWLTELSTDELKDLITLSAKELNYA